MDFIEQVDSLTKRAERQIDQVETEEATKNALVMPFIRALDYDPFNLSDVVPEFTADVGTKKGEKVDYALIQDGQPVVLFECKTAGTDLDRVHASQLYRYFNTTDARVGVLTDGVEYRFYSDLEEDNKMDERPFLKFDLLDVREAAVEELKKLRKDSFDEEEIIEAAGELKYTRALKKLFAQQLSDPTEKFVKFCARQVYSGHVTQRVRDQFRGIVKRAMNQLVSERVSDRFKMALESESVAQREKEEEFEEETSGIDEPEDAIYVDEEREIVTTEDEMQGYYIVKGILSEVVDPERVADRDVKTYFNVLLDDNNRKPICRFRFGGKKMTLSLIDENKDEERVEIDSLDEIYQYADRLRKTVGYYDA